MAITSSQLKEVLESGLNTINASSLAGLLQQIADNTKAISTSTSLLPGDRQTLGQAGLPGGEGQTGLPGGEGQTGLPGDLPGIDRIRYVDDSDIEKDLKSRIQKMMMASDEAFKKELDKSLVDRMMAATGIEEKVRKRLDANRDALVKKFTETAKYKTFLNDYSAVQKEIAEAQANNNKQAEIAAQESLRSLTSGERWKDLKNTWEDMSKPLVKAEHSAKKIKEGFRGVANAFFGGLDPKKLDVFNLGTALGNMANMNLSWEGILATTNDLNATILRSAASVGFMGDQANEVRIMLANGSDSFKEIGLSSKEALDIMLKIQDSMAASTLLSREQVMNIANISKGLGIADDRAVAIVDTLSDWGVGFGKSEKHLEEMRNQSIALGLNVSKVIENYEKGLAKIANYSFKNGIRDLEEMAIKATTFGANMDDVFNLSESFRFTIEGSVQATAKLQALGGKFASTFSNPFDLMYKSRSNPKALLDDIIAASSEFVQMNKETGQFEIPPLQHHRIKEIASALGMSADSIKTIALQTAKISTVGDALSFEADEDTIKMLGTLAVASDEGGFQITVDNDVKKISELTPQIIEKIKREQETLKETAKGAITFDKKIAAVMDSFKTKMLPFVDKFLEPMMNKVAEGLGALDEKAAEKFIMGGLGSTSLDVANLGVGLIGDFPGAGILQNLLGFGGMGATGVFAGGALEGLRELGGDSTAFSGVKSNFLSPLLELTESVGGGTSPLENMFGLFTEASEASKNFDTTAIDALTNISKAGAEIVKLDDLKINIGADKDIIIKLDGTDIDLVNLPIDKIAKAVQSQINANLQGMPAVTKL